MDKVNDTKVKSNLGKEIRVLPTFGQVVSCYFPEAETPNKPGIKARPCLVLRTAWSNSARKWYVDVAYGTSVASNRRDDYSIDINDPGAVGSSGLARPTRFDLMRRRVLPLDLRYFRANLDRTPILGRLPQPDIDKVRNIFDSISTRNESPSIKQAATRFRNQNQERG